MKQEGFYRMIRDMQPAIGHMRSLLVDLDDSQRCILVGTFIANLVGPIPDDVWGDMMKQSEKPCGKPGCTCHIAVKILFDGINTEREEWKKNVDKADEARLRYENEAFKRN